jgi:hypothetical protein
VNEPNERWGGVGKTPPQTHSQLQTEGVALLFISQERRRALRFVPAVNPVVMQTSVIFSLP